MVRNLWASCEQSCAYIKLLLAKYGQKFVSKLGAILCLHKLHVSCCCCCSRLGKGRGKRLATIYSWHSYEEKAKFQSNLKGLWSFRLLGVQIVVHCHSNLCSLLLWRTSGSSFLIRIALGFSSGSTLHK
jgi:hypothetical protein